VLACSSAATLLVVSGAWAKVDTWRREGSSAFSKCKREGVVLSDSGELRLGRAVEPLGTLSASHVWDLVKTKDGTLFAATGDEGKVFRRESKEGAPWTLAYDAADTQALSLAVLPDGKVFVGTGPSGQVVEISDPKHPASNPDPKVQYVWDLAADPQGNLYAATGPTGQLWKRSGDGRWTLLHDSKHTHLLCLAIGPDGSVYAGSDGEGLIYRVSREGKVSIVYDAPQSEIRTLLAMPDGSLYAGTAAESGTGSGSSRGSSLLTQSAGSPRLLADRGSERTGHLSGRIRLVQDTKREPSRPPGTSKPATPGGSAAPRPASPGDNAVYHVNPDGVAREVFRSKVLIFSLAWAEDRLFVGTGPEGQLFEVRDHARETIPLTKLDNTQILALLAEPDGGLILGAGDPGAVVRLSSGYLPEGTMTSEVHDAKLLSRFGTMSWQGGLSPETAITAQLRTGNVGDPDETWSPWSAEQTKPAPAIADVPPGRFVQYRIKLSSKDSKQTPELRGFAISFRSANLPPEISRLEIPDVSAKDGAIRQTRLNVRWDVTDPNDDDVQYTLEFRKEGWPEWVRLGGETPITEKTYAWDVTAVPSGSYRLRLTASDRPSNSPDDASTDERTSNPFLIDHDAPTVTIKARDRTGAVVTLSDGLTRLVKADYAVDGGVWTPIFPDDGLFDSPDERITVSLPNLNPGTHLLMIQATDAAGNVGAGDILLEIKK
jgi:hypothetical protein